MDYTKLVRRVREASHYFSMLRMHAESTDDEIKDARRRMASQLHPDINGDPKAHNLMAAVNKACDTLLDASQRVLYMATLPQKACEKCAGRGCVVRQTGYTKTVKTICGTCNGSGRYV